MLETVIKISPSSHPLSLPLVIRPRPSSTPFAIDRHPHHSIPTATSLPSSSGRKAQGQRTQALVFRGDQNSFDGHINGDHFIAISSPTVRLHKRVKSYAIASHMNFASSLTLYRNFLLVVLALTQASTFTCRPFHAAVSRPVASHIVSFSLANNNEHQHESNNRRRDLEFLNLEPLPENDARRRRIENDMVNKRQFIEFGDDLWSLRARMDRLVEKLIEAINEGDYIQEQMFREMLLEAEAKDPELVYMLELSNLEDATNAGHVAAAEGHRQSAAAARKCLPKFNLEGLWVGKYGSHGFEMINVTYVGDSLIATKLTGDQNIPRGEITFQANLHPLRHADDFPQEAQSLEPIKLTEKASHKWGTKQLLRYSGLGQVAEKGFSNHQWMEGQLIVMGETHFSFAWLPIEQQIFFGRPSPEFALNILRHHGVADFRSRKFDSPPTMQDDLELQKVYATRCLEHTNEYHDDVDGSPIGSIWHASEPGKCYFE